MIQIFHNKKKQNRVVDHLFGYEFGVYNAAYSFNLADFETDSEWKDAPSQVIVNR